MQNVKKKITFKDLAFIIGFGATVMWAFASHYSIRANKARIEQFKNGKND